MSRDGVPTWADRTERPNTGRYVLKRRGVRLYGQPEAWVLLPSAIVSTNDCVKARSDSATGAGGANDAATKPVSHFVREEVAGVVDLTPNKGGPPRVL